MASGNDSARDASSVRNGFTGEINGSLVQAGAIYGDVNLVARNLVDTPDRRGPLVVTTMVESCLAYKIAGVGRGFPASERTTIKLTIEALTEQAVVVHALRPVVRKRYIDPREIGKVADKSPLAERDFDVVLDSEPPRLVARSQSFRLRNLRKIPFSVTAGVPQVLVLRPIVRTVAVEWDLEVDWTCGGHQKTIVVDDGGLVFRLSPSTLLRPGEVPIP